MQSVSHASHEDSVAGCVTVLREARAAQTVKLAAIRYMVIYQLALSFMYNVTYFLDGSRADHRQVLKCMSRIAPYPPFSSSILFSNPSTPFPPKAPRQTSNHAVELSCDVH